MNRQWLKLQLPTRTLITFTLGLLLPGLALAAEPVRVLTEHLPPYQIDQRSGVSGFATEVVRRTFDQAGIGYQIELLDWSRAYQLSLRHPDTCIYSISKSPERTPLFQWIGAISYNVTAMYSLSNRTDIHLTSIDDARKLVTAVTRDDITHHYLLKHGFVEGKQLYVLENVASMLNVLAGRNKIDLVIINDTILKYRAEESKVPLTSLKKQLVLPDLPLDFHLACSLKTPKETVQRLTHSLMQLKKNGEFNRIVAGWSEQFQQ